MTFNDLMTLMSLTDSVNKLPSKPSKIGAMGLYEPKGVTTTTILIDQKDGRLIIVPTASRDSEGQPAAGSKRSGRTFQIPHIPLPGRLLPGDIQNILAFGGQGQLQSVAQVIADKLQEMKDSIDVTVEWHRLGGIGGQILDADGSVIYDLFDEFGVTKKSITIPFSNKETDIRQSCMEAKRHAEKKLGGVVVTGYRALCDAKFFDALTGHPNVQKAYANYQEAADRLGGDMRSGFRYGDIEFIEYTAEVSGKTFIPEATARVFPVGRGVFKMYYAPANYNETVNTIGLPYYARSEARPKGKGHDLEVQTNPLAMCMFPEALVELKAG